MAKTDKIIESAKNKSTETLEKVLSVIEALKLTDATINFSTVSKVSGVARSYLYRNPVIRQMIIQSRENDPFGKRTKITSDSLVGILQAEIKRLEAEKLRLQNEGDDNGSWRRRYEREIEKNTELREKNTELRKVIAALRKQLETAYEY